MVNHFEANSKRIEGEVSRKGWNEIRGRFIESYLIFPNPKLDDGEWMEKYLNFLFIGMVGHEARLSYVRT